MNSIQYIIASALLHSSFFLLGMNYYNQRIEITVDINLKKSIAYFAQFNGTIKPQVPVTIINYKTIHSVTGQPIFTHMSFYPRYLPLKMIQNNKDKSIETLVQIGNVVDRHGRLVMSSVGTLAPNSTFVPTTVESGELCYYHPRSSLYYVPVTITLDPSFKKPFSQQLEKFYNKPVLITEPICSNEDGLKYAIKHEILEVNGKELYHGTRGVPNKRKYENIIKDIENSDGLSRALRYREIGHKPRKSLKDKQNQQQITTE